MIQRFILISNHVKAIAGIGGLDSVLLKLIGRLPVMCFSELLLIGQPNK
jgi:hypothetical protein